MKINYQDKTFLPPMFLTKMEEILPKNEISDFIKFTNTRLRKSIRINTLKAEPEKVIRELEEKGFKLEKMPWYEFGFFITERPEKEIKIGNTLAHFLGYFYVQEASSMLPPLALEVEEKESVLDVAAAPGSKTTQMAMHMNNTGLIVANEPQLQRIKPLQENLERSGAINHVITRNDGRFFKKMPNSFDKVLLDAPCSVEGTFRKDIKARFLWTQNKVLNIAKLQYELLLSAIETAKPGATIVYSTCTLSPEENELVVNRVIEDNLVSIEKVKFKGLETSKGITKYRNYEINEELKNTVRIWPHKTNMEGFFLAKLKKLTKN